MGFFISKSGLGKVVAILIVVIFVGGFFVLGYFATRQPATPTASPSPTVNFRGGNSVVQSSDGGYVIAGSSLVKTDSFGNMQWKKPYVGTVVQSSDGGNVIAGWIAGYTTLIKTDASGNMIWNKTYGDGVGYSIIQSSDGGYIIAGYKDFFGARGMDVYLVKTDSSGNIQWNKTYGNTHYDAGHSVVQSSDGGYVIAAEMGFDGYLIKTDASGNMVWNKTCGGGNGYCVVKSSDGGYIITGPKYFAVGTRSTDVYLVKTDSSGNIQWNKTYGGNGPDAGRSVVQTSDGGYAIAGSKSLEKDVGWLGANVFLVKTDSSGNIQWNKTYGGTGSSYYWEYYYGDSIVQSSDGGYMIAGYTTPPGGGKATVYLVKTDASGNMVWSKTY